MPYSWREKNRKEDTLRGYENGKPFRRDCLIRGVWVYVRFFLNMTFCYSRTSEIKSNRNLTAMDVTLGSQTPIITFCKMDVTNFGHSEYKREVPWNLFVNYHCIFCLFCLFFCFVFLLCFCLFFVGRGRLKIQILFISNNQIISMFSALVLTHPIRNLIPNHAELNEMKRKSVRINIVIVMVGMFCPLMSWHKFRCVVWDDGFCHEHTLGWTSYLFLPFLFSFIVFNLHFPSQSLSRYIRTSVKWTKE